MQMNGAQAWEVGQQRGLLLWLLLVVRVAVVCLMDLLLQLAQGACTSQLRQGTWGSTKAWPGLRREKALGSGAKQLLQRLRILSPMTEGQKPPHRQLLLVTSCKALQLRQQPSLQELPVGVQPAVGSIASVTRGRRNMLSVKFSVNMMSVPGIKMVLLHQ